MAHKKRQSRVFKWEVDQAGYDLIEGRIVRRGGRMESFVPREVDPPIHFQFANLRHGILDTARPETRTRVDSPLELWEKKFASKDIDQAILEFVRKYGFLGVAGTNVNEESVEAIKTQFSSFELFYGLSEKKSKKDWVVDFNDWLSSITHYKLTLELDESGNVRKKFVPLDPSLIEFMRERVISDLESGVEWVRCENCHRPLALGPGYRSRRGVEEGGPVFCSVNCKTIETRRRKAKEK